MRTLLVLTLFLAPLFLLMVAGTAFGAAEVEEVFLPSDDTEENTNPQACSKAGWDGTGELFSPSISIEPNNDGIECKEAFCKCTTPGIWTNFQRKSDGNFCFP